jgi:hypothetical protein
MEAPRNPGVERAIATIGKQNLGARTAKASRRHSVYGEWRAPAKVLFRTLQRWDFADTGQKQISRATAALEMTIFLSWILGNFRQAVRPQIVKN